MVKKTIIVQLNVFQCPSEVCNICMKCLHFSKAFYIDNSTFFLSFFAETIFLFGEHFHIDIFAHLNQTDNVHNLLREYIFHTVLSAFNIVVRCFLKDTVENLCLCVSHDVADFPNTEIFFEPNVTIYFCIEDQA